MFAARLSSILIVLAVLLVIPANVVAQGFYKGFQAYERGDYAEAARLFRPFAEQQGEVLSRLAQYYLGMIYLRGRGVPQDYSEAARWFRLAADQGDEDAMYNLGKLHKEGRGVPQSYELAGTHFRNAASRGHGESQRELGIMYHNGDFGFRDFVEAHMWFNLAAANGTNTAAELRQHLESRMNSLEILSAQQRARDWSARRE